MPPRTLVHLRLDETDRQIMPSDAMGSLADLAPTDAANVPAVADAFTGRGRVYTGDPFALIAQDVTPGASLATRDCTIRAIASWDGNAGNQSTILARGTGGSAAEYVSYALEVALMVDNGTVYGELRWWWQTTAGVVKVQSGGHFASELLSNQFVTFTATRRWVSSTRVELAYYVGDQLIGEVLSADGDIGGGTTGTFCLGGAWDGATVNNPWAGVIDEVQVLNYVLSPEEVEATWLRLSTFQPRGYRAVRDLMPPGAPISDDPSSRVQKLFRLVGHALGYAAAQIENVRRNLLPDRAFGTALERWEGILGEAPRAPDSIAQRRTRLVAHMRQHAGVSVPGVQATLADLLQVAKSQVQVYAFAPTVIDDMTTAKTSRWMSRDPAQWVNGAGGVTATFLAADDLRTDAVGLAAGLRATVMLAEDLQGLVWQGKRANAAVLPASSEVGVLAWDFAGGDALFFGLENNAGTYRLVYQAYENGVATGAKVVLATIGNVPVWLRLRFAKSFAGMPAGRTTVDLEYSTTSATTGFVTAVAGLSVVRTYNWVGFHARSSLAALGAGLAQTFNDARLRTPRGRAAFRWYAYRDPTLPGAPDMLAATAAVRRLKHAHTYAAAVQTLAVLCDDSNTGCVLQPLGGY